MFLWLLTFYQTGPNGLFIFYQVFNLILQSANKIFSKKNHWVVVYPEQELWLNYRKPRPLQKDPYYYAAKMNVPIISCFVEIKDTNKQEKLHPEFNKTRWNLSIFLGQFFLL